MPTQVPARRANLRRPPFWSVAALVALGLAASIAWGWRPLARLAYVADRAVNIRLTAWDLRHWPKVENAAFRVYYPPGEADVARTVLGIATHALPFEEQNLDEFPRHQLLVVVYPTEAALDQAVGEPPDLANIGYDYDGVIDILSPKAWLGSGPEALAAFRKDGPVPHELGHALLDLKADQNYPHWFNEGVAQYEDYRVTGYQWITPTNSLRGPLYSMAQLSNATFYSLPDQSRAYREGLALVEYLEGIKGHHAFLAFLHALQDDVPFNQALSQVYHFSSPDALFHAWLRTLGRRPSTTESPQPNIRPSSSTALSPF